MVKKAMAESKEDGTPFSAPPDLPEELREPFQKIARMARADPKAVMTQGLMALAKDPEAVQGLEAAHRTKALEGAGRILGSLQAPAAVIARSDLLALGSEGLRQLAEAASFLERMGVRDLSDSELQALKDSAVVSSVMEDGLRDEMTSMVQHDSDYMQVLPGTMSPADAEEFFGHQGLDFCRKA